MLKNEILPEIETPTLSPKPYSKTANGGKRGFVDSEKNDWLLWTRQFLTTHFSSSLKKKLGVENRKRPFSTDGILKKGLTKKG